MAADPIAPTHPGSGLSHLFFCIISTYFSAFSLPHRQNLSIFAPLRRQYFDLTSVSGRGAQMRYISLCSSTLKFESSNSALSRAIMSFSLTYGAGNSVITGLSLTAGGFRCRLSHGRQDERLDRIACSMVLLKGMIQMP